MRINRRSFLAVAAAAGAATNAIAGDSPEPPARDPDKPVTTLDIRYYLLSNSPWVDPDETVDTVKHGDPERPVKKAGVCWMPSIWDIRAAHAAGCDLLICHEPTFWEHAAPEKVWRECLFCPRNEACDEIAMMRMVDGRSVQARALRKIAQRKRKADRPRRAKRAARPKRAKKPRRR